MSKKILLVHGWGGSDAPHWQAWLAGEIAKDYGCVNFLRFSETQYPHKNVWRNELLDALDDFAPDIVICHSVACTLWMHLCNEKALKNIEHLILVAPPSMHCDIKELSSFFPLVSPRTLFAKDALLIASDNDPYMPLKELKSLQNELNIKTKILKNTGHINSESGFGEWPWMREYLKSLESR